MHAGLSAALKSQLPVTRPGMRTIAGYNNGYGASSRADATYLLPRLEHPTFDEKERRRTLQRGGPTAVAMGRSSPASRAFNRGTSHKCWRLLHLGQWRCRLATGSCKRTKTQPPKNTCTRARHSRSVQQTETAVTVAVCRFRRDSVRLKETARFSRPGTLQLLCDVRASSQALGNQSKITMVYAIPACLRRAPRGGYITPGRPGLVQSGLSSESFPGCHMLGTEPCGHDVLKS